MNYLIVVAHPDDETLGAGATIQKLIDEGHKVAVAIMVSKVAARANLSESLESDKERALKILGVRKCYEADFPNIKMNTVPHIQLVRFIEDAIEDYTPPVRYQYGPS